MMQVSEINALMAKFENTVDTFSSLFSQDAVIGLCERDMLEVLPEIFEDGSSINYMRTHFHNHIISLIEKHKIR